MSNIVQLPFSRPPGEGYKYCPLCAEEIRIDAIKCKYCQSFLVDLDEEILYKKREEVFLDSHPTLGDKDQLDKHLEIFSKQIKSIKHKDLVAGGLQKRVVVILFADISNYTGLSEKLDVEELKSILDDCYNGFYKAIVKYEGFVDKFIGDAVMALFGVPRSHEDDPVRAVKAALEMLELTSLIGERHNVPLSLSVGINMGSVLLGSIGGDLELDYTALGDPVNLACRLEQNAPKNTIFVSESVYNSSYTHFRYEEKAPIRVKGKTELIPIYRVVEEGMSVSAQSMESRIPFIGRQKELKVLEKLIDGLDKDNKPHFILVEGEVGVGKTRYLDELHRHYESSIPVYKTRGVSYLMNAPYYPVLMFLKKMTGVGDEDTREEIELKCRALVQRYSMKLLYGKIFSYYLGSQLNEIHKLTPRQRKDLFFESFYALIKTFSGGGRLVFILDDMHWYDLSSLSLVEYLVESARSDKCPILFLGAYRPLFDYKWQIRVDKKIYLEELSEKESKLLVNKLLKIDSIPPDWLEVLYEKSKGNPFYIKEMILHLVESGMLAWDDDQEKYLILRKADVHDFELPLTVYGLIQSRIDVLSKDLKELLLCASVIGSEFRYRLLKDVYTYESDLKQKLQSLMDFEMIFEKSSIPELQYLFKHALTRDVAYNSLLKKQKENFHRRIGLAIESIYSLKLDEYYELLAFHFTNGNDLVKSLYYLEKAGEKSELLYASQAALDFYTQACQLLEKTGINKSPQEEKKHFEFIIRRVNIHNLIGEFARSLELLKEKEKKVQKLGNIHVLARYNYAFALVYYNSSQVDKAMQYLKKAQDLYAIVQDKDGDRKCNNLWGTLYLKSAQYGKARKYFHVYLKQAMKSGDLNAVANVHNNQGLCYWYCGEYEKALDEYRVSMEIRQELPNKKDLVATFNNIGIIYERLKKYSQSLQYYREGLNIALQIGYKAGIISLYVNMGQLHYYIDQLDEAREYYQKASELCTLINEKACYSLILGNQALIDIRWQNYNYAWQNIEEALKIAEKHNYYESMANACINAVRLYGEQGQKKAAGEWFKKADDLIRKKNMNDFMEPLREVQRFA